MTKLLLIAIFIFLNQLSANNEDEKIFKTIISNYNVEKPIENFEFTEEQSKILCGEDPTSIDCEIKTIYVVNEITKKRILYLLNQISQKYNIDKKLTYELNSKFLRYIEKNQKVDQIVSYCLSSICYEKSIRDDLNYFENNLESILDNKIKKLPYDDIEVDNNLNYEVSIKNSYKENLELIEKLKNNDEIEYQKIKNDFVNIQKLWNDYETTLALFLNKTKNNNSEWKEIFYKYRFNDLNRCKDYFEDVQKFEK